MFSEFVYISAGTIFWTSIKKTHRKKKCLIKEKRIAEWPTIEKLQTQAPLQILNVCSPYTTAYRIIMSQPNTSLL